MAGVFVCDIVDNERLNESVYSINIICPEIAGTAKAGQFVNIKCGDDRLLRRPISICRADAGMLKLVFEVKGGGTEWLSGRVTGQRIDILGPLGNGFGIPDGNIVVVGGGIGTPPMLFAAESAKSTVTAVLGFRDAKRIILKKEFDAVCDKVYISTDDGSFGKHGTVATELPGLFENDRYDAVLACGSILMLRAVAEACKRYGVPCHVSLEERMACGVGACMVCACRTVKDGVEAMSRVCKDGPVLPADLVVW